MWYNFICFSLERIWEKERKRNMSENTFQFSFIDFNLSWVNSNWIFLLSDFHFIVLLLFLPFCIQSHNEKKLFFRKKHKIIKPNKQHLGKFVFRACLCLFIRWLLGWVNGIVELNWKLTKSSLKKCVRERRWECRKSWF